MVVQAIRRLLRQTVGPAYLCVGSESGGRSGSQMVVQAVRRPVGVCLGSQLGGQAGGRTGGWSDRRAGGRSRVQVDLGFNIRRYKTLKKSIKLVLWMPRKQQN